MTFSVPFSVSVLVLLSILISSAILVESSNNVHQKYFGIVFILSSFVNYFIFSCHYDSPKFRLSWIVILVIENASHINNSKLELWARIPVAIIKDYSNNNFEKLERSSNQHSLEILIICSLLIALKLMVIPT